METILMVTRVFTLILLKASKTSTIIPQKEVSSKVSILGLLYLLTHMGYYTFSALCVCGYSFSCTNELEW